ncbi:MAG: hypothetical protein A2297_04895 [Elusimicrobia bacterium RIFOXYB2_FULL_48_7]|nr:MAG: hypothetical protein A2297_04895 [Elusimicrobia bacterium RIFOXYB2_FULL_48_7]
MLKRNFYLSLLFTLSCSIFTPLFGAVVGPTDHLWIRQNGKYIVTSPYATQPNTPFVPMGMAYSQYQVYQGFDPGLVLFKFMPYYCRNNKMNTARFAFSPGYQKSAKVPTPESEFLTGPYGAIAFVELCKAASIYVILDGHQSMGINGSTQVWRYDFPADVRTKYYADWNKIADTFKNEPWVLAYEAINECMPGNGADYVRETYLETVRSIRQADTRHLIYLGCGPWNSVATLAPGANNNIWDPVIVPTHPDHNMIFHSNSAISSHFYATPEMDSLSFITKVRNFQDANNIPFTVGEFMYASAGSGYYVKALAKASLDSMLDFVKEIKGGWFEWQALYDPPILWCSGYTDCFLSRVVSDGASPIPQPASKIKITDSGFAAESNTFAPSSNIGVQFEATDINPSAVDTLQVEIRGQPGSGNLNDAEFLTLTETGANTGIFRGTIATAASAVKTSSNNVVEVRTGNAEIITASYGPYITDNARSNLTLSPVASMQLDVICKGYGFPMKLQADGTSLATVRAILKDSSGEIAKFASMPVSFSVSPAYAYVVGPNPVTPVNGIAETTVCSSLNPGQCTITASGDAIASAGIEVIDYWYDFKVQRQDATFASAYGAVMATDDPAPRCRATYQNLSGIEQSTEGYEYSTDGGATWSGITEDFTSSSLDSAKWALHGSASKVSGNKGVRLTANSVNQLGHLEYVPGIDMQSWRMRFKWGVKGLQSVSNQGNDFLINFYDQDTYTSSVPLNGFQIALPYTSTQDGGRWKLKLYSITSGVRSLLATQYYYNGTEPSRFLPEWAMTMDIGIETSSVQIRMDGWLSDSNVLFSTITLTRPLKGFSFCAKTGSSYSAEHWVYDVRAYNALTSVPLRYGRLAQYSGSISSYTRTTDDIPFSAGAAAGVNQIKFIHYPFDDLSFTNERSRTASVNMSLANDSTPPSAGTAGVRDGTNSDVLSVNSASQMSANWDTFADAESGISRYLYSIGTAQGSDNVVGWTSTGMRRYVTTQGLSLTVGVTYYFSIKAENGSGVESGVINSNGQYAELDLTAPLISNITAKNMTGSGATITWDTDEQATSRVEYGLDTNYGSATTEDTNYLMSHSVAVTGLTANTLYHYRVISKDRLDNQRVSDDYTFTTGGGAVRAYPNPFSLKSGAPMKFSLSGTTGGEIKIFTVSARLVKTITVPAGTTTALWDCKNTDSEKIRPGLYLYTITENDGTKTTGRLAAK